MIWLWGLSIIIYYGVLLREKEQSKLDKWHIETNGDMLAALGVGLVPFLNLIILAILYHKGLRIWLNKDYK